ncbi:MAG: DUF1508 domain-containing protein [Acidobacteria bacterium]|nr:DUF1508 domain-containing protein [Acidobacteriota bacterium]
MRFEKYRDNRKEWRWRLYSKNNRIIAVSSEGYDREDSCDHSIELVKQAVDAPVKSAE